MKKKYHTIPSQKATLPPTRANLFLSRHLTLPIIKAEDSWGNWSFLSGMAFLAQVCGEKTKFGRLLGAPVSAMALTFFFASIGILQPGGTQAAKSLQLLSLQLATPLILLGADLRDCVTRCGPLLKAFAWASISTIIAGTLGWLICGEQLMSSLGSNGLIIAAALMAKNIGGGINYVAVCRCLAASPEAFAAGLCVDNIFGLIYFPVASALAAGKPDLEDNNQNVNADKSNESEISDNMKTTTITIKQVSILVWLATTLVWLGELFGGKNGALPICTLLTVLLASLAPLKWIQSLQSTSYLLGSCALYLFFSTAGAPGMAVAGSVRASILPLGSFLLLLYGIHGSILAFCCKAKGSKGAYAPQRLLVASSAAIGGPATAVALAQTCGWKSLIAPSLLVGNVGYAIATFIGLGYHRYFAQ